MARIQAFRARLGDSPQDRLAGEKTDQALARDGEALAKIDERMRIYERAAPITEQIEQTRRQLASLGFQERSADFDQLAQFSKEELALMQRRLLKQLKTVTLDKGADHLQERFLERIQTMTPQKLTAIAEKLKKAGYDDPAFQKWLRSFRPNASREVLAAGARDTLKAIEKWEPLEGAAEGLNAGNVEGAQDAFLELVSLYGDYPALNELKAVAAGTYQVAEAGAVLWVLSGNEAHLSKLTEEQLARQKELTTRMKALVQQRNGICAALSS